MSDNKTFQGILSANIHKTLDPVCLQFTFHALNAKNTHARARAHVCVCAHSITVCFPFLHKNFKIACIKYH